MSRVCRPRADDRRVINGILYVFTTGCRWMDMPPEYIRIRLLEEA
jgi:transposase